MIKSFFKDMKNFVKTWRYYSLIFYPIKMNEEKMEYILSGIDPEIRKNYSIIYSPTNLILHRLKKNKDWKFNSFSEKDVSYNFNWSYEEALNSQNPREYIKNIRKELKERHEKVMENLRLNHLRYMTNLFSNKINEKIGSLEEVVKINLKANFEKGLLVSYLRN